MAAPGFILQLMAERGVEAVGEAAEARVEAVETVRAASVGIHQRVMRGPEQLTDARVTAAILTPDGRPKRQPRDWVERFEQYRSED